MSDIRVLDTSAIKNLADGFAGDVLLPEDADYETVRKVHNGLIDKRPAAIARCATTEDVAAAVRFATGSGLEIAVRGGGHNVAGRSVSEGGLMIDLSRMRAVSVDAEAKTARAQGGALWSDLNTAAHEHGLAVTGGVISSTGIGGYTLGGGLGWLMSTQGLAADNLIGVELVTATGEVLQVDDESHPDLMWALRGGGGNFGVATALTFRLRHQPMVVGGLIVHPIERAGDMLRFYREAAEKCPDELTVFAALVHAPDGSGMKVAGMLVCHTDPDRADADLTPFLEWGPPVMVEVGPMPYPVMNTLLDAGYPKGALNYWLSSFTTGITDELIDTVVKRFETVPSPMTGIVFEHFHGQVTRIDQTAAAVPHREPGWNLLVPSEWMDPSDTIRNIEWTKDTFSAITEQLRNARWLNYLGDDQADDAIRAAYGPNYDRLREVKRRYDPGNVFHLNHNIAP
ncbi:MAG TPA: FAD-binding oxidoreductase [Gaiellales bacterium]|jgi:FAD/FMN-containing dehydrogenase|nr:FAD-binding oxidoreductase [Gaiellales bacterium]